MMKAVLYYHFGVVDELVLGELPIPAPGAGQVLVKVHATSVNVIDSRVRTGFMGPMVNKKFPKIPGSDFAGLVAAVAPDVREFKEGDAVYGAVDPLRGGALAEFVVADALQLAPKPESLSFQEAAALPIAGLAALLSVRDLGQLRSGDNLLIHGASGGIGLFAIQIAKKLGARVTAVAGTVGLAAVRAVGAHNVIDYRLGGGMTFDNRFDVIINASGKMPFAAGRRYLQPAGRLIEPSPTIPVFIGSKIANLFRRQQHLVLQTNARSEDLAYLSLLVTSGDLKVLLAKTYPFTDFKTAFVDQEKGGIVGKVVIAINPG